jgi:hypothetical protein
VNDHIGRTDNREVFVRRYSGIGVAVECKCIVRPVAGDLGPDFDLRRKPVLPAKPGFDIAGFGAGALSLKIVDEFGVPGQVVERG